MNFKELRKNEWHKRIGIGVVVTVMIIFAAIYQHNEFSIIIAVVVGIIAFAFVLYTTYDYGEKIKKEFNKIRMEKGGKISRYMLMNIKAEYGNKEIIWTHGSRNNPERFRIFIKAPSKDIKVSRGIFGAGQYVDSGNKEEVESMLEKMKNKGFNIVEIKKHDEGPEVSVKIGPYDVRQLVKFADDMQEFLCG
ncbi:hypothetical protein ACFL96_06705 [Thermoproteota archaeon]